MEFAVLIGLQVCHTVNEATELLLILLVKTMLSVHRLFLHLHLSLIRSALPVAVGRRRFRRRHMLSGGQLQLILQILLSEWSRKVFHEVGGGVHVNILLILTVSLGFLCVLHLNFYNY